MPLRRPLTMALHWTTALFVAAVLAAGLPTPGWIGWTFGLAALALALSGFAFGRMNRAAPKLSPRQRQFHRWSHWAMYAVAGWAGLAMLAALTDTGLPGPRAFDLALVLFALSLLHALFHIWRATVLMDGAFRLMLPKALHAKP